MNKSKKIVWDILSTPTDVDFKKYREEHDQTWLNMKREVLWIEDMETEHIISCINMLERNDQQYTAAYTGLTKEINRRYKDNARWKYEN
jgi:hypothetical protein